jgi:hypothetical protein
MPDDCADNAGSPQAFQLAIVSVSPLFCLVLDLQNVLLVLLCHDAQAVLVCHHTQRAPGTSGQ